MAQNRLQSERIDVFPTIQYKSYNVPGHECRMRELCQKVQEEYFDTGLHYAEMHLAHLTDICDAVTTK